MAMFRWVPPHSSCSACFGITSIFVVFFLILLPVNFYLNAGWRLYVHLTTKWKTLYLLAIQAKRVVRFVLASKLSILPLSSFRWAYLIVSKKRSIRVSNLRTVHVKWERERCGPSTRISTCHFLFSEGNSQLACYLIHELGPHPLPTTIPFLILSS